MARALAGAPAERLAWLRRLMRWLSVKQTPTAMFDADADDVQDWSDRSPM